MKKHGHYCKVCGEYKANENFSGKGHASCAAKNRACGNARIFMVKIRRAHGKHDR